MTPILSWYAIDEAWKVIDSSLELFLLKEADLPLTMSVLTSMFIMNGN